MSDEDSDDDFDELFADFNNDDDEVDEEDSNFIEAISANLRESVGFKQGEVVHKGDVDEGLITWIAPESVGVVVEWAA